MGSCDLKACTEGGIFNITYLVIRLNSSGVKTGIAFLLLIVKDYNHGFLFFVSFCLYN